MLEGPRRQGEPQKSVVLRMRGGSLELGAHSKPVGLRGLVELRRLLDIYAPKIDYFALRASDPEAAQAAKDAAA